MPTDPELIQALERLCSRGRAFDPSVAAIRRRGTAAKTLLVQLLCHPDPGWQIGAAAALARLRATPASALPGLLRLLRSPDAGARLAALAAIEWLPPEGRSRAISSVIRLLMKRRHVTPAFTVARANVPRAVAAHFLGLHGGARGIAALQLMSRWRSDPIAKHIADALDKATGRE
jgi:hypothetical protein